MKKSEHQNKGEKNADGNPSPPANSPPMNSSPGLNETRNRQPETSKISEATVPDRVQVTKSSNQFPLIDGYEIIRVLGRGGMGIVYLATDLKLNRQVAIKTLIRTAIDDEMAIRLENEAKLLAQLNHNSVAQLYEAGVTFVDHHRVPFFAMEFVEGPNLSLFANQTTIKPQQAARIVATLANALNFCHGQGVIHRDLKPSNVLMDPDGCPKLTDFGLGRMLDNDVRMTRTGEVMGSPTYMSPEQASGVVKNTGPATDVYGLGVILFELLSGRPPFEQADPLQTMVQVLTLAPPKLRSLDGKIPVELESITDKCLEKSPKHRYQTAAELENDLNRFLNHEPILARPTPFRRRAWLWTKKYPLLSSLAVAMLLGVAVAVSGFLIHIKSLNSEIARSKRIIKQGRNLSQWLLDDYSEQLGSPEGVTYLRGELADQTQKYLDQLLAEDPGDEELVVELAYAFCRLAQIQGQADGSNLGRMEQSKVNIQTAERLMSSLRADDFGVAHLSLSEQVRCRIAVHAIGMALRTDQLGDALSEIANADKVLLNSNNLAGSEKLLFENQIEVYRFQLALAKSEKETMQASLDQLDRINREFAESYPLKTKERILARVQSIRCVEQFLELEKRNDELLQLLIQAKTEIESLASDPPSQDVKNYLANVDTKIGNTHFRLGNAVEAIKHYRAALENWLIVEKLDRGNQVVHQNIALAWQSVGESQTMLSQLDDAKISFEESELSYKRWMKNIDVPPSQCHPFLLFLGSKARLLLLNGDVELAQSANNEKIMGLQSLADRNLYRRAIGDAFLLDAMIEIVRLEQMGDGSYLESTLDSQYQTAKQSILKAQDHFEAMATGGFDSQSVRSNLNTLKSLGPELDRIRASIVSQQ